MDGGAEALGEECVPLGFGDELAGDKAQGDLRIGAVKSGAERDAAVVGDGEQGLGILF